MSYQINSGNEGITENCKPLTFDEIVNIMKSKWGVTYDCQILVRNKVIYFQIMWAYVEQKSYPLNYSDFRIRISKVVEILNRGQQNSFVRDWLLCIKGRPRFGRALTLRLNEFISIDEFAL